MPLNPGDTLPDYMYAADIHNVANGKPSIIPSEESSTYDALTKGSLSVIARAVTSTINTIPAATNWLGITEVPEWQTEDLLKSFDDDLAAYYSENRETIDIVGDVAAAFVPGMAGVKALNYAQVGLKGLSRGNAGKNILQSIGALPDATAKYAALGKAKMMDSGNTFKVVESNALKAFGSAYAQNALEFAAFEIAAATTMGEFSPLFKEHTATDILYNAALGGGVIGMGVLGTVSAVQTYGALKRARDVVDRTLNPARHIAEVEPSMPEFSKLLNAKHQLDNPPVIDTATGVSEQAAARVLERRNRDLNLSIQESATKLAGGDSEVGKLFAMSLRDLPSNSAWAATLHLDEVGLVGAASIKELKVDKAIEARKILADETALAAMTPKQIKSLEADAAHADVAAVKYLNIKTGQVDITPPAALGLADKYSLTELNAQVSRLVGKDGVPGIDWTPLGKSIDQVEARYIAAASQKLPEGTRIVGTDLPYLEAAYQQGLTKVIVDGIELDSAQLLRHIKGVKEDVIVKMIDDAQFDVTASTHRIAKTANVDIKLVEGGSKGTGEEYFGVVNALDLKQPSVLKVVYNGDPAKVGVSGDVLSGMATIKQMQEITKANNKMVVTSVLGEETVATLPQITDQMVLGATSAGAGAGLLSAASGSYNTLASLAEWTGKVTNRLKVQKQKEINEIMQPSMYKVLQNGEAGLEIAVLRQKILETGEKYVLKDGEIVHKSVAAYENKLAAAAASGKMPRDLVKPALDAGVAERIPLKTQEAKDFMQTWVTENDKFLAKQKMLKQAIGKDTGNFGGEIYFPQPDSRKFPFFSMVVPKNPAEAEKVQMLWAATADDLANLESKVPAHYSILRKADTDRYHKAVRDYDYELGFSAGQMSTELKRTGAAAPFIPKTDPQQLLQEMLEWKHRMSDMQVRDAVTLHNQVPFSELRRMDAEYTALQQSTKAKGKGAVDSPFSSYVATALDIPRTSHVPLWTEFNNLAENVYSRTVNKVRDVWGKAKTPEELAEVNKVLDENGVRGFKDAYAELFANHPAGGRELSNHVMVANGALSTLLLRTDPMNALNNGVGSLILTGAETSSLIKMIKGMSKEADAELLSKAYVGVPGSEKLALSPAKLIAGAYADWVKLLAKDPAMVHLEKKFGDAGFLPSMMDQIRSVMDHSTLSGLEKAGELSTKTKGIMSNMGEILEKVSGNRGVEEMNRFVSAHIADTLSGIAVRGGKMTEAEQYAFINTFVNRTQGNYLASQRPLMFQGPVGHAISLFQTYAFNIMQHIFRRVESGDKKQLAVLLGLQTGLYGFNGLPAFDFMNRTLVGTAAGNISGQDLSSTMQNAGGDVGNWFLYGGLSSATGLGLYSRGDLNPRHMTILPSSIGDVPFISATRNALGSMFNVGKEVMGGADVGSSFLRGLEHANISRPLAGLATTLQGLGNEQELGYTTTGKNGLMYSWDMYSLQSLGRIAGAKPLDEAIARDAYHRVQVYDSHRAGELRVIGSAIRDKVRGGEVISEEDQNTFLQNYLHKGGDQKNFIKFMQSNIKKANVSQINAMTANLKTPGAQYMQSMIHGAEIPDIENYGETAEE